MDTEATVKTQDSATAPPTPQPESEEMVVVINGVVLRKKFANLYGTWGSDTDLETKGVILSYELRGGGFAEFKIKRAGARNVEWRKVYNEVMGPHNVDIDAGKLTENENKFLLAEVYSRTVIIGWNIGKDSEGKEIPFDVKTCMELMCFMPDLLQQIIGDAHERSNFQYAEMEKTGKN